MPHRTIALYHCFTQPKHDQVQSIVMVSEPNEFVPRLITWIELSKIYKEKLRDVAKDWIQVTC